MEERYVAIDSHNFAVCSSTLLFAFSKKKQKRKPPVEEGYVAIDSHNFAVCSSTLLCAFSKKAEKETSSGRRKTYLLLLISTF